MRLGALVTICVCVSASTAAAQGVRPARTFVSVNGGYQVTANDFDDSSTFTANAEEARLSSDYRVQGGPAFDVAGGVAVWRRLSLGVGVMRFTRPTPVTLTGSVPHPFHFNQPRAVTGAVSGVEREELAVNVHARFDVPVTNRLQVALFGGPSWVRLRQGIATRFTWTESYPYDEAAFGIAQTTSAEAGKVGLSVGSDVSFFFTRRLGVGAVAQYAGATVRLRSADVATQDVKAGGARFGGGLRLRF